jgi:two-component system sensor histidine kinase BaeS
MRGHVMRRMGCLFGLVFLFAVALASLVMWTVLTAFGFILTSEPVRLIAVAGVLLGVFGMLALGRGFRRIAAPIGDLVEAVERIEAGDYDVVVPVRGPREIRSLARAINAMTARLSGSESRRRTFLADVTHELRTPLTVIRGQVEGLIDAVYPADAEHLEPILEETRVLERLVEDLRTLSLAESGSLTLAREAVDLAELIGDVVAAFHTTAAAGGVELGMEVAPDLPRVDLDPLRIRGVLVNLLANALRHTPAGGSVTVATALASPDAASQSGAGPGVHIAVRDTGEGIAPELLPTVFDRFVKDPASRGSGLGLAIARSVVEAHGGAIAVASTVGQGTTFTIALP